MLDYVVSLLTSVYNHSTAVRAANPPASLPRPPFSFYSILGAQSMEKKEEVWLNFSMCIQKAREAYRFCHLHNFFVSVLSLHLYLPGWRSRRRRRREVGCSSYEVDQNAVELSGALLHRGRGPFRLVWDSSFNFWARRDVGAFQFSPP